MRLYFYVLGTVLSLGVAVGSQNEEGTGNRKVVVKMSNSGPLDGIIQHRLAILSDAFLRTQLSLDTAKQQFIERWYETVAPKKSPSDLEDCAKDLIRVERITDEIGKFSAGLMELRRKIRDGGEF